jgi:hypothetical protein
MTLCKVRWFLSLARPALRPAIFVLLFAVLCLPLQRLLISGLRKCTGENLGTVNAALKGRIDAEILISGSSRAVFHYDPRIIEACTGKKTYNIGRDGCQLDEQLALFKAYLRHNRKPEYLIQNLDAFNLRANDGVSDDLSVLAWLHEDELYNNALSHRRYFMSYRCFPLIGFLRHGAMKPSVEALFGLTNGGVRVSGFFPQDKTWNDDFEKFRKLHPNGVTWPINPEGRRTLEGILEVCRQNDISVILVFSPEYKELQNLTANRREIISAFREISAEFRVPFWDYSQDPISSERDCFYNSSHLNRKGATAFSELVGTRLARELGLHQASPTNGVTMAQPSATPLGRSTERGDLKEDGLGSRLSPPSIKSVANN